jgi:hypothetical protein
VPRAILSFNQVVGSRQAPDAGFKEAPVLTDKGRVRALGGGVCQVSSTLYAAALLTDLAVIERHAHAMPVPYVEPGLDATVSSVLDLKIQNPHPFAVQIRASAQERRLQVELWGEKPPSTRVRLSRYASRCVRDGMPAVQVTVWACPSKRSPREDVGRRVLLGKVGATTGGCPYAVTYPLGGCPFPCGRGSPSFWDAPSGSRSEVDFAIGLHLYCQHAEVILTHGARLTV